MNPILTYLRQLTATAGAAWNRFWFTPSLPGDLGRLRIAIGMVALLWQLSYTPDLMRWFGPQGWLDAGVYHRWVIDDLSQSAVSGRFSYLFATSPTVLWILHILGTLVLIAYMVGFQTRLTSVAAFAVVLAYVHRAPFVNGMTEVVLCLLIGYSCLSQSGAVSSVDARLHPGRSAKPSVGNTIARRLMQVHLSAIYAVMFTTQLISPVWWNGEAIWWLHGQASSQWIHLGFLRELPIVLNVWTFGMLFSELAMSTLVWNRTLRPLIVVISMVSWSLLALATGRLGLPLTMMVANSVFLVRAPSVLGDQVSATAHGSQTINAEPTPGATSHAS